MPIFANSACTGRLRHETNANITKYFFIIQLLQMVLYRLNNKTLYHCRRKNGPLSRKNLEILRKPHGTGMISDVVTDESSFLAHKGISWFKICEQVGNERHFGGFYLGHGSRQGRRFRYRARFFCKLGSGWSGGDLAARAMARFCQVIAWSYLAISA